MKAKGLFFFFFFFFWGGGSNKIYKITLVSRMECKIEAPRTGEALSGVPEGGEGGGGDGGGMPEPLITIWKHFPIRFSDTPLKS